MIFQDYNKDYVAVTNQRNTFLILLGVALITNVLLAIYIFRVEQKTIVVPASLNRDIVIGDKHVRGDYLEEMTYFFVNSLLDLTPARFPYQKKMIMRHVAPESYKEINLYLEGELKRYQKYNLVTHFQIETIQIDQTNLSAEVGGELVSNFGKTGESKKKVKICIEYAFKAGQLLIKKFAKKTKDESKND